MYLLLASFHSEENGKLYRVYLLYAFLQFQQKMLIVLGVIATFIQIKNLLKFFVFG